MNPLRPFSRSLAFSLALGLSATAALAAPPAAPANPASAPSDALKAPRPKGGEYFGLYLMGKKVGYLFTDLTPVPDKPAQVQALSEMYFKASVGARSSERTHREVRFYEAKPQGRLISFHVEEKGDGGDQT